MMSVSEEVQSICGLKAVPASGREVLPKSPSPPEPIPVSATPIPDTPLARRVQAYAKEKLPRPTFHHSMRVYHFGVAIFRQHFPEWNVVTGGKLEETWFLCAMLHDIATTDRAQSDTVMSFELHGGIIALDVLQKASTADPQSDAVAPRAQAESVAESIVRHQDIGERGNVSTLTQMIQLATIFDNTGEFEEYVHKDTIEDVNIKWPREQWMNCFATTLSKEMSEKPWCTTTRLGRKEFPKKVCSNELMKPYE